MTSDTVSTDMRYVTQEDWDRVTAENERLTIALRTVQETSVAHAARQDREIKRLTTLHAYDWANYTEWRNYAEGLRAAIVRAESLCFSPPDVPDKTIQEILAAALADEVKL